MNTILLRAYFIFFFLMINFLINCSDLRETESETKAGCSASDCHGSTKLGSSIPISGKHTIHLEAGYECGNCHNNYVENGSHRNGVIETEIKGLMVFFDSRAESASWEVIEGSCSNIDCHYRDMNNSKNLVKNGVLKEWIPATSHWYSESNGCVICHGQGSPIDPVATNGSGTAGKHTAHVKNRGIDCLICHYDYKKNQRHMNGLYGSDETLSIVNFSGVFPETAGSPVITNFNDSTGECSSISCHGGIGSSNWYLAGSGCMVCHNDASINPMVTSDTGLMGKHTAHVNKNIACESCHYNYTHQPSHMNGVYGKGEAGTIVGFSGMYPDPGGNPVQFAFNDGTGQCDSISCHANTGDITWYVQYSGCKQCHRKAMGSRRQVVDSNGDGTGTGGDFNTTSHHVIDYDNPSQQIIVKSDCTVCHEQTNHMEGVIKLKDKDNAGQVFTYNPSSPSSLEPFCLSCHDSNGASTDADPMSPFSSTNVLGTYRNIPGNKIKTNWMKSFGHGTYGNHASGDKLTCMGTGAPGTGCHGSNGGINAHGSANKVLAASEYNYPLEKKTPAILYNENWFALCFNCHAAYPGKRKEDTLGVKAGGILDNKAWLNDCMTCHYNVVERPFYRPIAFPPYYTGGVITHFADHNTAGDIYGLNDGINPYTEVPTDMNLHWVHLGMLDSGPPRGTTISHVVCSNCHSVHGSNTPYGAVHDEIGYVNVTDSYGNIYGKMKDEAYGTLNIFASYPTYCVMNCHESETGGPTKAWFKEAGKNYIDE